MNDDDDLMKDVELIYKTANVPERRVFMIDAGDLSTERAMAIIDAIIDDLKTKYTK